MTPADLLTEAKRIVLQALAVAIEWFGADWFAPPNSIGAGRWFRKWRNGLVRGIGHRLWMQGFPKWKRPLPCHTCGRLSNCERDHVTHRCGS